MNVDTRTPPRITLKVPEVAAMLGKSDQAIRRLIRAGHLRARKSGAEYLIRPAAVDEYLDAS